MKTAARKISGLALALSLYGLLSPRPKPMIASSIACVAFLPSAFTRIAKIATLLVPERGGARAPQGPHRGKASVR